MKIDSRISRKLTLFSFVFSIGMVLYHSLGAIGAEKIVSNNDVEECIVCGVNRIRGILGGVAMHYFFFTSAFLLYYNMNSSNWKRKVSNRVISLGIPYIVWNVPFIVIQLMKNREVFNIRLLISRVVLYPFIGPSWYLLGLLLLLAFAPVCVYVSKIGGGVRTHTGLCILIILINQYFLNLDLYILSSDFSAWLPRLFAYVPTYFIGMHCGLYYAEYYTALEKNKLILLVMLGTSLVSIVHGGGNNVVCILFIIACWYISDYFIDRIHTDRFIYRCAFLIYMGHDIVLRILSVIYSNFQQVRGYFLLPLLLISGLITVVSMNLFAVALNRYCPRLLGVITGSRFYR